MGIPDKERKGKNWKEERMGLVGVFRMEADLDSEQKTRRGGMNINTTLCWKIVTMDIIESRREKWEAGFIPGLSYRVCTRRCT